MPIIVTARALIIHQDQLLVTKQKPEYHFYALPGGKLEVGETVEAGLVRELTEETGIPPQLGDLLYVSQWISPLNHRLEFFFSVKNSADYRQLDRNTASHGFEVVEFAWIDPRTSAIPLRPGFLGDQFSRLLAENGRLPVQLITTS